LDNANFASRLRQAMDTKGISLSQLALKSGLGKSTISGYLAGQYVAKSSQIAKLAQNLDCDARWLEGMDTEEENRTLSYEDCLLEVFEPEGLLTQQAVAQRSAPPEYADDSHFFLQVKTGTATELLLCHRQKQLLNGHTGIYLDDDIVRVMRCEQRCDAFCLIDVFSGQVLLNAETQNLETVARVILSVREW